MAAGAGVMAVDLAVVMGQPHNSHLVQSRPHPIAVVRQHLGMSRPQKVVAWDHATYSLVDEARPRDGGWVQEIAAVDNQVASHPLSQRHKVESPVLRPDGEHHE